MVKPLILAKSLDTSSSTPRSKREKLKPRRLRRQEKRERVNSQKKSD